MVKSCDCRSDKWCGEACATVVDGFSARRQGYQSALIAWRTLGSAVMREIRLARTADAWSSSCVGSWHQWNMPNHSVWVDRADSDSEYVIGRGRNLVVTREPSQHDSGVFGLFRPGGTQAR